MNYFRHILTATLLLSVSANDEIIQPFRVGIGVDLDDTRADVCTDAEVQFMKETIQKYVIGLARLFFRDQTIELSGDGQLMETNTSHFSAAAFADFNSYEVTKFAHATGEIVDTTGTAYPTASLAPSASPTKSPVEVFLHIEEEAPLGVETGDPVAPDASASDPVALQTLRSGVLPETSADPVELVETDAPVASPATSAPVTGAPVGSVQVTEATVSSALRAAVVTAAPVTAAPVTAAPVTPAPVSATDAPISTYAPVTYAPVTYAPATYAPVTYAPVTDAPVTDAPTATVCEENCINLDFNTYPNGTKVERGAYVSDEWQEAYGVRFQVYPFAEWNAYAPTKPGTDYRQARIFDTSNPGTDNYDDDPDLGSPNESCGGPGQGVDGQPGKRGENCDPLGNALIIQESNKETPDDSYKGGYFKFVFDEPVELKSLGFLDLHYQNTVVSIYTDDGTIKDEHHYYVIGYGTNAAQAIHLVYSSVVKVVVTMPQSGAITFLNYCLTGCATAERRLTIDEPQSARRLRRRPVVSSSRHTDETEAAASEAKVAIETEAALGGRKLQRGRGYRFVYGGNQAWMCRFCGRDSVDGRRLMKSGFLISALETVLSFGLTADTSWNYKDFLEQQNKTFGCLGDGNSVRVAFELTATN